MLPKFYAIMNTKYQMEIKVVSWDRIHTGVCIKFLENDKFNIKDYTYFIIKVTMFQNFKNICSLFKFHLRQKYIIFNDK